jgi:hypothetical protein
MYTDKISTLRRAKMCADCKGLFSTLEHYNTCSKCMNFKMVKSHAQMREHKSQMEVALCKTCKDIRKYVAYDTIIDMHVSEGSHRCEGCRQWFKKFNHDERMCERCYQRYSSENKYGMCDPNKQLAGVLKSHHNFKYARDHLGDEIKKEDDTQNTVDEMESIAEVSEQDSESSSTSDDSESEESVVVEDVAEDEPPRKKRRVIVIDD